MDADNTVKHLIQKMDRFAKLHEDLRHQTLATYTLGATKNLQAAQQVSDVAQREFTAAEDEWKLCTSQLELLRLEGQLIEQERPGFWARLVKNRTYRNYLKRLEANRHDQGEW